MDQTHGLESDQVREQISSREDRFEDNEGRMPVVFDDIKSSSFQSHSPQSLSTHCASLYMWFHLNILATQERKCHHHLKFSIWNLRGEGTC